MNTMKRIFCLLLVLVMILSLSVPAFADIETMYCRMCGKKIPADSKICSYCGEKVVRVEQNETDAVPAQNTPDSSAAPSAPAPGDATTLSTATDVKTALAQSSAPSPATQTASVPGPFNTTLTANGQLPSHVRVTKSPTSESVPYGGSCMFIAHAVNATSVTWYIASPDASLVCAASDAPSSISGLYVSGANSDTLYLSGIPSWMNGCQVQACFTGEGGPVYTEIAKIWTYQEAAPSSCSSWSFWDWFNYYYWDDPCYDWPDYIWYSGRPSVAPSFHPEIDTEPAEVKHIGHYDPLHPWDSWWDPSGRPVGDDAASDQSHDEPTTASPDLNLPDPGSGDGSASTPPPGLNLPDPGADDSTQNDPPAEQIDNNTPEP